MSNNLELKVSKEERVGDNNFGFKLNAKLSDVRGANARMNHSFQVVASGDGIIAEGETFDDGGYEGHFVLPLQRAVRKTIRFIINNGTSVIFKDVGIPSVEFLRREAEAEELQRQADLASYFKSIDAILTGKRGIDRGETVTLRPLQHDVTGIMSLYQGGKLVVPAGAVLRFGPDGGICSAGVLRIEGCKGREVLLRPMEPGKSNWQGVTIYGGEASGSLVRHAVIEGCKRTMDGALHKFATGGGIVIRAVTDKVELCDVTVRDCEAFEGGGIYLRDAYPTMSGLNISGNRAEYGGGIFVKNAGWMHMKRGEVMPKVKIVNSAITRNVAGKNGGGIFAMDLPIQFEHTVVTNNSAEIGGGFYVYDCSGADERRSVQHLLEYTRYVHHSHLPAYRSGRLKFQDKIRPPCELPIPPADKHYGESARMHLTLEGCEVSSNKAGVGDQVFISWGAVASGSRNKIARVHCEAPGYRPKL